jgi:Xaa-Pro aminopeptidase
MTTRRDFVAAASAASASALLVAPASAASSPASPHGPAAGALAAPSLSDISFAQREPFLNRERATAVMAAEGLDAMVVGRGTNVFYTTNFFPLSERMSVMATALAVVPRDARRPVALVIPDFSYYYIQSDDGLVPGVQPFVFTHPAGDADPRQPEAGPVAGEPRLYRLDRPDGASPRERRRRAALDAAAPYSATMERALARALRELGVRAGRIGYDDPAVPPLLARALPGATAVAAEDTLRRVRLVRTPAEVKMMRIAAQNNVDAALATIAAARSLGSLRAVRQRFYAEAALRGNLGVFMIVDGVSSDAHDEPLVDGRSFLVDCVSQCRNFHGDFGRTVFVGEPTKRMKTCTDAMGVAWADLQPRIRPGLRFSEVRALGAATLAKLGQDVPVAFGPHSVGLAHNDQPRAAPDGGPQDLIVEANMILSVDCPLAETGSGGTAHLEDLVLITPRGAEPIHTTGSNTYLV